MDPFSNPLEIQVTSAGLYPTFKLFTKKFTAREVFARTLLPLGALSIAPGKRGQTCIWNKTKVKLWQKQLPNKNFEPLRIKLLGRVLLCNQGYFSALNFVPNFTFTCFCNLSISPIRMDSFNCFVDCDESLDSVEIFGN